MPQVLTQQSPVGAEYGTIRFRWVLVELDEEPMEGWLHFTAHIV